MGPTWGPSGGDRTQVGPLLAPWTLLSVNCLIHRIWLLSQHQISKWCNDLNYQSVWLCIFTRTNDKMSYLILKWAQISLHKHWWVSYSTITPHSHYGVIYLTMDSDPEMLFCHLDSGWNKMCWDDCLRCFIWHFVEINFSTWYHGISNCRQLDWVFFQQLLSLTHQISALLILYEGKDMVTSGFPSWRGNNAESFFMTHGHLVTWDCHYDIICLTVGLSDIALS